MAIAIPPPQRGKHCNTITTDTPDDNCPLMCKRLIQSQNSHCYKNKSFWSADEHCAVQLNQLKTLIKLYFTNITQLTINENHRNTTKMEKKCAGSLAAATVLSTYSYYNTLWAPAGTPHCAGPFRQTPLTVLHTQVFYHCTAHTGAVTLYCTQRCRTTVLHTQVLYTCNTHMIAASMYCTHRFCKSTKYAKKQTSPNHTPLKTQV